jgi:adenylate kinase family enzyme
MKQRIHIFGAPGSGVSSIGRVLAQRIGYQYFDVDDFVWFTDDALPYRRKRNKEHRLAMLKAALASAPNNQWVLGGALCGWGDCFIEQFDLVVYVHAPFSIRKPRITAREQGRYGADRVAPEGDLYEVFERFLLWADQYDAPENTSLRSAQAEADWLREKVRCHMVTVVNDEEVTVENAVERLERDMSI